MFCCSARCIVDLVFAASQVCKNFVIGCCSYGQTCIYHHPDPIQLPGFNPTSPFASSQLSNSAIPHGHSPSMTDRQLSPHVPDAPLPFADQPSGYFPGYNSQVEGITPPWGYPIPIPTPPGSYKPISWRTTLCRHFVKNKGWCPVGDACGYIHDLTLHPHRPTLETKIKSKISGSNHPYNDPASSLLFTRDQGKSRVIGGGVPVGSRGSHCWAYVQGSCGMKVCRYYHPKDIQPCE